MRLCYRRGVPMILGVFTLPAHRYENTKVFDTVKDEEEVEEYENEKWKRLKKMYSFDEYGSMSPQLILISEGALMSFFTGFIFGGVGESKLALKKFLHENQLTAFQHHLEAKRKLQDTITLSVFKGGYKLGWRLCLLTTSILVVMTSINSYRGSSSIIDFTIAGGATCALYKFKQGPKPAISGGFVGGLLGSLAGVTILGLMKISGITFEDIYKNDADKVREYNKEQMKKTDKKREDWLASKDITYRASGEKIRDCSKHVKETMESSNDNVLQVTDKDAKNQTPLKN